MASTMPSRPARALPALLLLWALALPVAAQDRTTPEKTVPEPVASKSAGAARAALDTWIAQLNDAAPEALRSYIAGAFAQAFLDQVPVEQALAFHQQLRGAGRLELDGLEAERDRAVVARLRSASGRWFSAQLSVAGDPPKIDGLLIQPDSAPQQAVAWRSLDELAARIAEDAAVPGVAVAWARPGEAPQVGVAGVRALGSETAVEPADRFHIGSITKSVTATALAALVEKGELRWHATLRELLPGVVMSPELADATLERLLRHLARIPQHSTFDDAEMARLNGLPGTPTEQRAAYVAEVLAEAPLAAGFHYSNAGYAIAGSIGERASGRSWEQLVRDEVLTPLGLASCGVGWPATEARPHQPRGHFGDRGDRRPQELDEYRLGAFMRPAGDLHCSVGDLARYGLAHLAGLAGEDGFLAATTIQELHRVTDQAAPYAAGWGIDPVSGQHRHNGSAGTFFAYLTIDPRARVVVAFVTNAGPADGQPAAERAAREILERYAGEAPHPDAGSAAGTP